MIESVGQMDHTDGCTVVAKDGESYVKPWIARMFMPYHSVDQQTDVCDKQADLSYISTFQSHCLRTFEGRGTL